MKYLFTYGSLIHPNETNRHAFKVKKRIPVKIFGYERIFNQAVTYRKANGIKAAVLNVVKKENTWINGVLLSGFSKKYHDEIDKRESGYDRIKIPKENIIRYDKKLVKSDCYMYIGKKGNQDDKILPIDDYLTLCLKGAKTFGKDFYRDFLFTTWVNGKIRLDKYVKPK